MRRDYHAGTLALAAFVILAGALAYGAHMQRRVRDGYEAALHMQQAIVSVRQLQTATRAVRSEPANLAVIIEEWQAVRADFNRMLSSLSGRLQTVSPDLPELRRLQNIWDRMESGHREIERIIDQLAARGELDRIGNSSLVGHYQEVISRPGTDEATLGTLGLLLFYLEHVDRVVLEVDAELAGLHEVLGGEISHRVNNALLAGLVVGLVSLVLVGGLLWRLARLFASARADLAARQRAEESARASEADLDITLNAIGEAVLAFDPAGRLLRMNPAAEPLIQWTRTEAAGRTPAELFSLSEPENRGQPRQPLTALLGGTAESDAADRLILRRRDGTERTVSTLATPIRDSQGVVRGAVLVIRDMTERERLEEQLRHTQRTESIGRLAGGVAHDFNNLLQVIQANASFLAEEIEGTEETREFISEISTAAKRAADLTRQLLALGRRQTLQTREVDPGELIRGTLRLVQRVLGEHIQIRVGISETTGWIRADPGQVEQVVINLCVNARDAMRQGGVLSLHLDKVDVTDAQARAWSGSRGGAYVRLSVADTGVGMDAGTLARVFEPFFTTKAVGEGSGLGLCVVQGIVHQHGGMIQISSSPGRGTRVDVYLPSTAAPAGGDDDSERTKSVEPTRRSELVLLVEDEPLVRNAARAILQRFGYRVVEAADGVEACEVARAHLGELAAAVLDVVMPRMGGVDAARRLREMRPDLPIMLCSGYAGGIDVPQLAEDSGWTVMAKPYQVGEFIDALQKAIAGRR